ncbi:uncharacterized protein LOC129598106 [Paramacrobiotus metropolitanus]|uniref:uncharacterized protein LOC129598106 n=1 Tax=Paramacrobiotus metropolitanus TaxID=2943436 RepID=UPI0024457E0B|nr:uncharacterized protein LOC129598106 [Paramacrobiotus metropolitanus]
MAFLNRDAHLFDSGRSSSTMREALVPKVRAVVEESQELVPQAAVHFQLRWRYKNFPAYRDEMREGETTFSDGITMTELGVKTFKGRCRLRITPTDRGLYGPVVRATVCFTDEELHSTRYTGEQTIHVKYKLTIGTDTQSVARGHYVNGQWSEMQIVSKHTQHDATNSSGAASAAACDHSELKGDCVTIVADAIVYPRPEKVHKVSKTTDSIRDNQGHAA